MLKIFQISINKNVIRDVQPSNHSITSKELQQMYLSENDYIGKCSCIVCREIKSKKGIHTHYHISHTEFGKIQHKEKSRIAAQASGKATQKKFQELYSSNPQYCQQCNEIIPRTSYGKQFCSQSCSAKWSNTHRTRTKKPRPCCSHCNKPLDFVRKKFCNNICSSQARVKNTTDERKIKRKITQKRYYQRIKAQTPIDADRKAIREFYKNCPEGYEVDHIIPISKGGLHSLENLQYLTIRENRVKSNKIL